MAEITATPMKLRNGRWGIRCRGDVAEGDVVTVTTRAGKTYKVAVRRVLWNGDGISICSTRSLKPRWSSSSGSRWCRCGASEDLMSIGYKPGARVRCPECGGLAEVC